MPETVRPDGARIHYEVHGEGFPVLLLADGAAGGGIASWQTNFYHPVSELAGRFRVIAVDQRHVGRSTVAPFEPFSYEQSSADMQAVLDDLGAEQAHVVSAGTGTALAWRLAHDTPARVRSVVSQDPVGLDDTNTLGTFLGEYDEAMRLTRAEGLEGVIAAAQAQGHFAPGNGAGPYAARLNADPAFRDEILTLRRERYVVSVVRFRDGIWPQGSAYFSVPEEWMTGFPAPLLILPGNDPLHPEGVAKRLASEVPNARLLDAGYDAGDRRTEAVPAIVSFLDENTPR
ncbi:alpha/beta hydrolase [Streptomyces sp. A0642]|uniref:alpha/beta fold hydrolase n=1 Tax=Streptomyces sp. A0642 TaxID=2563100 RepID=UPI0010A2723C|nr:alpha/beta hydrolase [Streptomyces sp. A0642]THA64121.1 alpha/beta hydrolase [Streptomyces sp. A0642]